MSSPPKRVSLIMGYNLLKYIFSISFSLFLFLSLLISHEYIEYPWNQLYETLIVFLLISLLCWNKKILILILCAISGLLLWIVNAYIGHPIDYLIKSLLIVVILFIAKLFCENKRTRSRV